MQSLPLVSGVGQAIFILLTSYCGLALPSTCSHTHTHTFFVRRRCHVLSARTRATVYDSCFVVQSALRETARIESLYRTIDGLLVHLMVAIAHDVMSAILGVRITYLMVQT
ncbi:hypothetical protein B0T22DRAFT_157714 [Podospora appendiculata]|uniref:Secreted protein n=1 Tax=Podospora appendiculata TaxID=314037 RepID=A0AAE0X9I4_9PEZI|nr:hypothetical protein B0T22DRAFT_157714 [Podospora appendiculata]